MSESESTPPITEAVADADDKLSPGDVPIVEYTGQVTLPATEGYTLLLFRDGEGNSVGVRLTDDEIEGMVRELLPFTDIEIEESTEASD